MTGGSSFAMVDLSMSFGTGIFFISFVLLPAGFGPAAACTHCAAPRNTANKSRDRILLQQWIWPHELVRGYSAMLERRVKARRVL